jgi:hypothetical protein
VKAVLPTILNRHIRHDLKKAHISEGLVCQFESRLIQFIDTWLEQPNNLDTSYLQLESKNQFERYVLHTISQYYGFCSFSKVYCIYKHKRITNTQHCIIR